MDAGAAAKKRFAEHASPPRDFISYNPGNDNYAWAIHGLNTAGVEFGTQFTTRPSFTATQGMEVAIPLSVLNGALGQVEVGEELKIVAGINNPVGSFWSNQFLPGISFETGNVATDPDLSSTGIDLSTASHLILSPPETLPQGNDLVVAVTVAAGEQVSITNFDVDTPGEIYIIKHMGNENRAGLIQGNLIGQFWSIVATGGLTFSNAAITFTYDENLLGSVPENELDTVYQVKGTQVANTYPITSLDTVNNQVTVDIPGPSFSDWYIGRSNALGIGNWQLLD